MKTLNFMPCGKAFARALIIDHLFSFNALLPAYPYWTQIGLLFSGPLLLPQLTPEPQPQFGMAKTIADGVLLPFGSSIKLVNPPIILLEEVQASTVCIKALAFVNPGIILNLEQALASTTITLYIVFSFINDFSELVKPNQ